MSLLLSVNKIQKTMGSKLLFENLSLGIFANEKIGLIGPNGSGKSTLLKVISSLETPDNGEVSPRKGLTISMVAQDTHFATDISAQSFIVNDLIDKGQEALQAEVQAAMYLSITGFTNPKIKVSDLSGGWKKRLAIARALAYEPELLILDEPTNHMDWEGILWLEGWLKSYKGSFILVSHDREFLNQVTNRTIEINPLYQDGYLSYDCNYQKFLLEKEQYIQSQMALQDSLSNKARREVEWLRAGVKARTTKSQSRIQEAHQLLEQLEMIKGRNRVAQSKTRLEIDDTERKTKKLLEFKSLSVGYSQNSILVKDLDLILGPKMCLGLLGDNGSGKSTLLKSIIDESTIQSGSVFKAEDIKVVYFDQKRDQLPTDINLMQFLGDGSDYVIFKNQSVHVAAYASRFLFSSEKMQLKIAQLSGGEQARLLIAKLLLQPADVLILDEPTNDLDIETIEVLEETLRQFEGLVILVSHDRAFLTALCDQFLALNGQASGQWATYASVEQWLGARKKMQNEAQKSVVDIEGKRSQTASGLASKSEAAPKAEKVKMSYKEKLQLQTIEEDIAKAETSLQVATSKLEDPNIFQNKDEFLKVSSEVQDLQNKVDELYQLWETLEAKSEQLKRT